MAAPNPRFSGSVAFLGNMHVSVLTIEPRKVILSVPVAHNLVHREFLSRHITWYRGYNHRFCADGGSRKEKNLPLLGQTNCSLLLVKSEYE